MIQGCKFTSLYQGADATGRHQGCYADDLVPVSAAVPAVVITATLLIETVDALWLSEPHSADRNRPVKCMLVYSELPGRQAVVLEVIHPVKAVDNCLLSKQKNSLRRLSQSRGQGPYYQWHRWSSPGTDTTTCMLRQTNRCAAWRKADKPHFCTCTVLLQRPT